MHIPALAALLTLSYQVSAIPVEVPHWTEAPQGIDFFARDVSINATELLERSDLAKRAWFYPSDRCVSPPPFPRVR